MKLNCFVLRVCCFIVACVFGEDVTVEEGNSVTLKTDIQKKQGETMLWYFKDTRIAQINKDQSTSCNYDGEGGRFKDRLEMDYEMGFLSIASMRFEDSGRYEAQLIRISNSGQTKSLNRKTKCDSTKIIPNNNVGDTIKTFSVNVRAKTEEESSKIERGKSKFFSFFTNNSVSLVAGVVAGVCVILLVVVFVAVVFFHRRNTRNELMEKDKAPHLLEDQNKDDRESYENPSSV
ncbi:hypothetical protein Q8A67_005661 [Cirrhinus molitorella]|uniref:Immunoglobulin subtype domain-containing protein n=1 Tax=Cirrhinus molitorella TaxID=172907 RepID=A0AA88PZE1_9TELE|nr:hypothetical protein Q8A67_005661 [Cirrhinus molitorella]